MSCKLEPKEHRENRKEHKRTPKEHEKNTKEHKKNSALLQKNTKIRRKEHKRTPTEHEKNTKEHQNNTKRGPGILPEASQRLEASGGFWVDGRSPGCMPEAPGGFREARESSRKAPRGSRLPEVFGGTGGLPEACQRLREASGRPGSPPGSLPEARGFRRFCGREVSRRPARGSGRLPGGPGVLPEASQRLEASRSFWVDGRSPGGLPEAPGGFREAREPSRKPPRGSRLPEVDGWTGGLPEACQRLREESSRKPPRPEPGGGDGSTRLQAVLRLAKGRRAPRPRPSTSPKKP
jgi:hypothetical protein